MRTRAALRAVKFKDYYEVLGVGRDAGAEEIRSAFRRLARKHHPDVASDQPGAEEKFKEINEAYEVLGDPEKRRKYDALGHRWNEADESGFPAGGTAGGDWHFEGTGFSDFFENFFGGRTPGGFSGGYGAGQARAGGDLQSEILVTLDEVMHGAERTLVLESPSRGRHTLRIRIPRGVSEGQLIRVAGHGQPGLGGARSGDLFLKVRLERHPDFHPDGYDIHHELNVAPWEAVLGATIGVPTPHGPARIKVPPGTAAGTQLRLKGKGLPHPHGHGFGDFFATLRVVTPTSTRPAELELWKQLAAASTFQPR